MYFYDTIAKKWRRQKFYLWSTDRNDFEYNPGGSDFPGMDINSMFTPYIAANTIWQRDVSSMPIHSNSATMANWMWTQSPTRYKTATGTASGAFGSRTSFNTSSFGTNPIVYAVVDSTDPDCHFQYMDSCSLPETRGDTAANNTASKNAILLGAIPWPMGLLPPTAGDKGLALFDRGTGIIREYFGTAPVANKPGHWTATTGGFSIANQHFYNWHVTNYPTQLQNGSSAVCLMHNCVGFVGADEIRRGKIQHALAFTMANATANVPASWPAVWSDGKFPPQEWTGWDENGGTGNGAWPGESPRHGQWARLPSSVDPMYNPRTKIPYNPLTRLLIDAAKTYGLVGTDTNAWAHAFNAESGAREKLITGTDPWLASGELANILRPELPGSAFDVSDFPWDLTEWATFDWGRPNPDFKLRPLESSFFAPH